MALVINTNVSSLTAQNNLNKTQSMLSKATEALSSGLKINSAADDAAGYAISQRFTTQIGGLNQANSNANDAISMAQTTESALSQITSNLQAVRDLAVQSANGTYTDSDRQAINTTVQQYLSEITRTANQTTFNGLNVLDGNTKSVSFQVGANVGQTITVNLDQGVRASQLGTDVNTFNTGDLSSDFASSGTIDLTKISIDGKTLSGTASSAQDLVDAINATDFSQTAGASGATITASLDGSGGINITQTGGVSGLSVVDSGSVAASGKTYTTSGTDISAGVDLSKITINGTSLSATTSSVSSASDLVAAINNNDTLKGTVTASVSGNDVVLTSSSAITIGGTDGANALGSGDSTGTTTTATTIVSGTTGSSGTPASGTATNDGSLADGSVLTVSKANTLIAQIDSALSAVSDFSSNLGAIQNRFQSTISTLSAQSDNLTSAQSTIQDANFASETADLSKANVLQQAGISVLATANSQPQQILKLLQ